MIISMEFFKTVVKQITDKISRLTSKVDKLDSKIVQSDWDTNDPEDPSYINNRICYEDLMSEIVLPDTEFVVNSNDTYNTNLGYYVIGNIINNEMFANVENAAEIDVTYDGVAYKNVSVFQEEVYVGGGAYATIINIGKIDKTPFYIQIADSDSNSTLYAKTTGTHTISISKSVGTYKKIESKYLDVCKDYNVFKDDPYNSTKIVSTNLLTEYGAVKDKECRVHYIKVYYDSFWEELTLSETIIHTFSLVEDGQHVILVYSDQLYILNNKTPTSLSFINVSNNVSNDGYVIKCFEISKSDTDVQVTEKEPIYLSNDYTILNSSTPDSTKKFKITVDDSGTISATEVTT